MYKLLVVDDEYESRNTLCSCFPWGDIGFEIVGQIDNGRFALDYITKSPVDVVLCDIKMPVMTGIELARELYPMERKPVLVFLSGYRDFEYAQKAMEYGVRYYIVKPARYEEVLNVFTQLKKDLDKSSGKIKSNTTASVLQNNNEAISYSDKIIQNVKLYVLDNCSQASLESISKMIHMNSCYLSQLFKQRTGINFSDYLIEVKMKKAAELLKNIEYKTYNVSEMVGYTNAKNFSRTFKSYYGISPKEYRILKYGQSLIED
jgi:Response regulator containing CheY-like receiver domain and AraC-type DNA-binding domain